MAHDHSAGTSTVRLFITMMLNFLITIVEIIGGIVSGSLSLISDALHNFSDGIAIIISYIAIKLKQRPSNEKYTFGYRRAEIIAAVFNASVLIGISLYLLFEVYDKFANPQPIEGLTMVSVASIGLIANVIGTILLHKGSKESLNIKSAYLHLFSDAVSSLAVIIGGLFIYFYDIYWLDPTLTVLILIYITKESYLIVKESLNVLMMAAPKTVLISDVEKTCAEIEEISNIHHIHLWQIDEHNIHFEAHVKVKDMYVSETEKILLKVEKLLKEKHGINHVTLQFESSLCNEAGSDC